MSLYDKPSISDGTPKIAMAVFSGGNFGKTALLLLGYLVLIKLINIVPTLGNLFSEVSLKNPSFIVSRLTSILLIGIATAFALRLIRAEWPLFVVAIFSAIRLAATISAQAVTTTFTSIENFSYLKYLDLFMWFGELDGLPFRILFHFGFKVRDLAVEIQRMVVIVNSIVPLFICGLLIYLGRKSGAGVRSKI